MVAGTLTIRYADGREVQHRFTQLPLRLGRTDENDVVVDDSLVSALHCELFADEHGYRIRDLDSTNGTFVDGQRLQPHASMAIGPGSVIEIGDARISIATRPADGSDDDLLDTLLGQVAAAPPPAPAPPPGGPPLGLSVVPARQEVCPGDTVTATVIVVNHGTATDQISIDIDGLPTSWATVQPPQHMLAPGAQGSSQLSISPPLAATTLAGQYALTVVAYPASPGASATQVPVRLEVLPFTDFDIALDPPNQAGWYRGFFSLHIRNLGNRNAVFFIQGFDETGALEFAIAAPEIELAPGESDLIDIEVRLRPGRVFANPQIYPFIISVEPADGSASPHQARSELIHNPPIPLWLLPAGLLFLLLLFGGLFVWRSIGSPSDPLAPVPTPSLPVAAIVTPDATGTTAALFATPAAAAATQAAGFTQTALVAAESNIETQTAAANSAGATQTVLALDTSATAAVLQTALAATSAALAGSATAAANDIAQTQTAFAQTVLAQTEQAAALAQTQTVQAINQTQTALAQPSPIVPSPTVAASPTTAPLPPTQPPTSLLLVSFDTLNGQPVDTRIELDGDEYTAQGVTFCVFALGDQGLSGYTPPAATVAQPISDCPLEALAAVDPGLQEFLNRLPPQRAVPVIYPPTVDAVQAPTHVLAVEPGDDQVSANAALALITFQRDVSEAALTVWQPDQVAGEFLLIAYDTSGQVSGRTQTGQIRGPNNVQLSVSSIGNPIQRLVVLPLGDSGGPLYISRIEGRPFGR